MDNNNIDNVIQVNSFDGQTVWQDKDIALYEVGNFLGGGAAGTVYECERVKTRDHYALKILNPLGYKLLNPASLRRCNIMIKGNVVSLQVETNNELDIDNVWWLINGSTKQFIAAFYSEKSSCLKELSLNHCIAIWGNNPQGVGEDDSGKNDVLIESTIQLTNGLKIFIPQVR